MDYMFALEQMKWVDTNGRKLFKVKQSEKNTIQFEDIIRPFFFRICVAILSPKALPIKLNMILSKDCYFSSCTPLYWPLIPRPCEGIPSCFFPCSPITDECLPFPLALSHPLPSFFTSLQFSLFKFCIYPNVWRAVEHGIFLLQWKSCGQTNSESMILNSIIIF